MRGWISLALGLSLQPANEGVGFASAWVSVNHVAVGARTGGIIQFNGEQRSDRALLVGGRTSASGSFVLAAVGVGTITSGRTCDCGNPIDRPSQTGFVYTVEAHRNWRVVGLGVSVFGGVGADRNHEYSGTALSLDVGWFGR